MINPMSMIYGRLHTVFRKKRFDQFVSILAPSRSERMIDVGGLPSFWQHYPATVRSIDSVNIYPVHWDESEAPEHHIRPLIGDGCALEAGSGSYDIAFSNSVIEHVGTWENQRRFAEEMRRVGKAVWVQTPARESVLEPHFMTLFVHHLPRPIKRKLIRWASVWGLLTRPSQETIDGWVDEIHLVTRAQMRELFPDCEILTERIFGIFPKSYIAVRRASRPAPAPADVPRLAASPTA